MTKNNYKNVNELLKKMPTMSKEDFEIIVDAFVKQKDIKEKKEEPIVNYIDEKLLEIIALLLTYSEKNKQIDESIYNKLLLLLNIKERALNIELLEKKLQRED